MNSLNRKPLAGFFTLAFALLCILQCQPSDSHDTSTVLVTVEADSIYVQFGKLWIGLTDSSGLDTTVIWNMDSLPEVDGLARIPVTLPSGKAFRIIIRGYESGTYRLVYEEVREVNSETGELIDYGVDLDLNQMIKQPFSVQLISRDTLVSINDSISAIAKVRDTTNQVVSFAWDLLGKGKFGPEFAFENESDSIVGIATFKQSGRYPILFRIKTKTKSKFIDTVWVTVVDDPPQLDAGANQQVTVGDTIYLNATANDYFGVVEHVEWRRLGDSLSVYALPNAYYVAPDTARIDFWVARATDDDGQIQEDTLAVAIIFRKNALLSRLEVSKFPLSHIFQKTQSSYSVTVPFSEDSIEIHITKEDPEATVTVGSIPLESIDYRKVPVNVGGNIVRVVVKAQNQVDSMEYGIFVTRKKNDDASLSNLITSSGKLSPDFSKDSLVYRVTLESSEGEISLTPTASDTEYARILVRGVPRLSGAEVGPFKVTPGIDTIQIAVKAQDDTSSKNYLVIVSRVPSRNALLKSLLASTGSMLPEFSSRTLDYFLSLSNEVNSISFQASTIEPFSAIYLNGNELSQDVFSSPILLPVGNSFFTFKVVSEVGDSGIYRVRVRRRNNDATLAFLSVDNENPIPGFSPAKKTYVDTVKGWVDKLNVSAIASDSSAKSIQIHDFREPNSRIVAEIRLSTGLNTIPIKVTAEDDQISEYQINIYRQSSDDSLKYLEPSVGTLNPSFSASQGKYSMIVANATEHISFKPTANSVLATIKMNGEPMVSGLTSSSLPLDVGENIVRFDVISESGDTLSYTVSIHRKSNNADLSVLEVDQGLLKPAFASSILAYADTVNVSTQSIRIHAVAMEKSVQSIVIQGKLFLGDTASLEIALSPFSVPVRVNIQVKAEDGNEKTYSIIIRGPGFLRTHGNGLDDNASRAVQTLDGGFAVIGFSTSSSNTYRLKLAKFNSDGDTLWTKTYGDYSIGTDMLVMPDNGFMLLGYIYSPASSGVCAYLIRTDAIGDVIWSKQFKGTDGYYGTSLIETEDGGFAIGGIRTDQIGDGHRGVLIRTNSYGDSLWTRTFGDTSISNGISISSILQASDGGFVLTGLKWKNANHHSSLLIKTSSNGIIEWEKNYFSDGVSSGNKVLPSPGGGYLIAGSNSPTETNVSEGFALRTNSVGDSLSINRFGNIGAASIVDIRTTPDGGNCLVASTLAQGPNGSDFQLIKADAGFSVSWTKVLGGSGNDIPAGGFQTKDGGFFMFGSTVSFGAGKSDWLLIKTNEKGDAQ